MLSGDAKNSIGHFLISAHPHPVFLVKSRGVVMFSEIYGVLVNNFFLAISELNNALIGGVINAHHINGKKPCNSSFEESAHGTEAHPPLSIPAKELGFPTCRSHQARPS